MISSKKIPDFAKAFMSKRIECKWVAGISDLRYAQRYDLLVKQYSERIPSQYFATEAQIGISSAAREREEENA